MILYYQCNDYIQSLVLILLMVLSFMYLTLFFNFIVINKFRLLGVVSLTISIVNDSFRQMLKRDHSAIYHGIDRPLLVADRIQFIYMVIWMAVLFILGIILFVVLMKIRNNYISARSVKQSIDTLPTGICCYDENGITRIVNDSLNSFSLSLFGEPVSNGKLFYEKLYNLYKNCEEPLLENAALEYIDVEEESDFSDEFIIAGKDQCIYSIKRYEHKAGSGKNYELIVHDITEEYNYNVLLEKQNTELALFNERLKKINEDSVDVIRSQELLNTKMSIHDNMNRVLVASTYSLDHPEADREQILKLWTDNFIFHESQDEPDLLKDIYDMASSYGIRLNINGELPADKSKKRMIMVAIAESMSNAVKHGVASSLEVEIGEHQVVISNDGLLPDKTPKDGGGFTAIRKCINAIGGHFDITYDDRFKVVITM